MKCLEQASPWRHKAHQRLPRAQENGGWGALTRVGLPSEAMKKVLKLKNEFSKVSVQNSIAFLYTSSEQLKFDFLKILY